MGLTGKLVGQKEIKSSGDLFHELFRHKPHHLSNITPTKVQGCDLHEGEWGTVGSIIFWKYFHEGKEQVAKEIIEAIDEEKKLVRYKVIEGDLLDSYKAMAITVHVETKGENHLVTWTFDYEKLHEDVAEPHKLMELALNVTLDVETRHLQ